MQRGTECETTLKLPQLKLKEARKARWTKSQQACQKDSQPFRFWEVETDAELGPDPELANESIVSFVYLLNSYATHLTLQSNSGQLKSQIYIYIKKH